VLHSNGHKCVIPRSLVESKIEDLIGVSRLTHDLSSRGNFEAVDIVVVAHINSSQVSGILGEGQCSDSS